jgi:hypothetical protein
MSLTPTQERYLSLKKASFILRNELTSMNGQLNILTNYKDSGNIQDVNVHSALECVLDFVREHRQQKSNKYSQICDQLVSVIDEDESLQD